MGPAIGTRTWGGEIWLSSNNVLVDRGIATAAEYGVYGPDGIWLIEGHGVDPDIVVDNLPHATFNGEDAQLAAAIEYLKRKIAEARFVITVSEYNRRYLVKQVGDIIGGKIRRLYNGIDLTRFQPRSNKREHTLFLAVGRLVEKKGFRFLVDASRI